ncbi:MAG TPA: site-2 protease family protein [Flavobacteriales bacterium]|nr:site-2 protease family protein [Flavobacteriales bacterium]
MPDLQPYIPYALAYVVAMLVHELGHVAAARWFGVRVDRIFLFYDANDRALFRKRIGKTVYGIGWLPLGSYVELAGMNRPTTWPFREAPLPWELKARTPFEQGCILVAGVVANVLVATACWCFGAHDLLPIVWTNTAIAWFNLLPHKGSDGALVLGLLPVSAFTRRVITTVWTGALVTAFCHAVGIDLIALCAAQL